MAQGSSSSRWATQRSLQLDGIHYPAINLRKVPVAFCDVDVKVIEEGVAFQCMMVSGHVASSAEGERKDTLRPLPAWFLFVKGEREEDSEQVYRVSRSPTPETAVPVREESCNLSQKASLSISPQSYVWSASGSCFVSGSDSSTGDTVSKIWFKTEPLDATFISRITELQLCTDSHDQGWANDKSGSWSWFELVILADTGTEEPVVRNGKTLAWKSHANQIACADTTKQFGIVFDNQKELLDALKVSSIIQRWYRKSSMI